MSTGDQSEYLRKKMAERRMGFEQGGQFMKSGFSKWAESERPARQGGAAKAPAVRESTKRGEDILDRVKKMGEDMFVQYYKGSARHTPGKHEESESEEETLEGGRITYMAPAEVGKGYSGNGKLVCEHSDMGHGTEIKEGEGRKRVAKKLKAKLEGEDKGGAKVPHAKEHGEKPSMEVYEREVGGAKSWSQTKREMRGEGKPDPAEKAKFERMAKEPKPAAGKKSARAELVRKVMKEKGLSLPAASKYVKEHGLYKK